MRRGYRRILGDPSFFIVTVLGNFILSLILGSVFYHLSDTSASFTDRCILLFFALLFNALNSALEVSLLALHKQHDADSADIGTVRPETDCREACVLRLLPSDVGSYGFHDMRSTMQNSLYAGLQLTAILHVEPAARLGSCGNISTIRILVDFDNVHDLPYHRSIDPYSCAGSHSHCAGCCWANCIHRFCAAHPEHASLAALAQLHQPDRVLL